MPHANPVVFGLGNKAEGTTALDWAASEAVFRGTRLEIIRSYHLATATLPWENMVDRQINAELRAGALASLRKAAAHVQATFPGLEFDTRAVDGSAGDVLIERSGEAALTVVGSRQLSAVKAVALGSVSTVVAAAAHGPVVVIEGPPGLDGEDPAVVVGVDGSESSDDALGYAFEHADRRGRSVRAVFCWPPELYTSSTVPSGPPPERAERWLGEALAGWQEKFPQVRVHRAVVRRHVVEGLISESLGADLLVVGARGRHARLGSLLGSVSQGVLHHAHCPVAVIHRPKAAR